MARWKLPDAERPLTRMEQAALNYAVSHPTCTQEEAMAAGYPRAPTWKRTTRIARAGELFGRPAFQRELEKARRSGSKKTIGRRERILQSLEQIAYTDLPGIIDYSRGTIQIEDFKALTAAQRACIKEFKVRTATEIVDRTPVKISVVEIKLHDKMAALHTLAKVEGMLTDRVRVENVNASAPTMDQLIAGFLDLATPEEFAVIQAMAERLALSNNIAKENACASPQQIE